MLAALDLETPMPDWKSKYFFGFRIERGEETEFSFRARDNGITFTCPQRNGRPCGSCSGAPGRLRMYGSRGTGWCSNTVIYKQGRTGSLLSH